MSWRFSLRSQAVEMRIELLAHDFDPWLTLRQYPVQTDYGATAVFVGTMREMNQGDAVRTMFLEHYPGMTEQQLAQLVEQACQRWAIEDCLLLHRVGEVTPQDTLVVVAVWSKHRGDALDACHFLIENLKHQAPFWKRETLVSGASRWVSGNSDGYLRKDA